MAFKQLHAYISGMVQGVGYRYFVQRIAVRLELNGYVRNLPDGSVEVLVEGDETQLNQLYLKLLEGPSFSRVENVQLNWADATGKYKKFQITY